jgi:hypothetical protein
MKKILTSLLILIVLFTVIGCGDKKESNNEESNKQGERESIKNQKGFKEGQYSIDNLTFSLPDGYELDGENRYTFRDTSNALIVELYVDDNIEDLNTFIKKDTHSFYPTVENLKETNINGNTWLKGKTIDNTVVYYIKDGKKAYSVMLSPVFTLAGMFDNLVNTFETSLYFKIN